MDLVRSLLPSRLHIGQAIMDPAGGSARQTLGNQRGGYFGGRSPPRGPRSQQMLATTFRGDQGSTRGRFRGRPFNRGGVIPRKKPRHPNARQKPSLEILQPPCTHGNSFGFMNVQPDRLISLADDHPLKEELAEVKRERELRKLYWAGLAQRIPEEMESAGSYDYQRWKEEEKLADAKIEELAGLIALAKRGIPVLREDPEPKVQVLRPTQSQPVSQGLQRPGMKRKKVRRRRGNGRRCYSDDDRDQNETGERGNRVGSKNRYRGARAPETVVWTDKAKSEAVAKWMRDMGAKFDEEEECPQAPFFISSDGKSISSFSDDNMDSDKSAYLQQNGDGDTIHGGNFSHQIIPKQPPWVDTHSQAAWTWEEEADFEEAETLREAERLELAMRMNTMINEPSSLNHVAPIPDMVMTTDPRLYCDEKTVHLTAPPKISQTALAINTTRQPTPRRTSGGLVEHTTASNTQPLGPSSSALHYVSYAKDHAAEERTSVIDEEEARKSSELLASLLEELNRSSESPEPEPESKKASALAPSYPASTAAPQSLPTLSRKQGIDKNLNKYFQEKRTESHETLPVSKVPVKTVNPILSNASTVSSVKSPNFHPESSTPPARTNVVREKQRAMAAAVLKRVQARKLELGISQQGNMAIEQQMTGPARSPSRKFTVLPSSDVSKPLETSEDSKGVKEKGTQHMQKTSDYMDIDEVDVVDVIDMQDAPESESEDGEAVTSIMNPMEIDSLSCSGEDKEDSDSEEDGGIRVGDNVVQHGMICGTHIERAELVGPGAPLPLAGRVLYIGNLSFEATEEDLREVLDDYRM